MSEADKLSGREQEVLEPKPFTFDTNSVIFMMYLLYKSNILTRHHLRAMMKVVQAPIPGDIIRYIVEEAGRAT